MSNNKKIEKASLFITLFIVVIGLWGIWFTFSTLMASNAPKTETVEQTSIKLDNATYEKISQPATFGTAVSVDEPGFGRENPFAPF